MDLEVAEWLVELIGQAVAALEHSPGLTIEVDEDPAVWVQLIPESDKSRMLSGYLLNLPYLGIFEDPLERLQKSTIQPPPDTTVIGWEGGAYATLWVRPDTPTLPLALFIGDLIEKLGRAPEDYNLSIEILQGL